MNEWIKKEKLLSKEFVFSDFKEAIGFVNRVAGLAEKHNHHPDIMVYDYKKVRLTLTTHDKGKVTEKDYNLADEIDKTR